MITKVLKLLIKHVRCKVFLMKNRSGRVFAFTLFLIEILKTKTLNEISDVILILKLVAQACSINFRDDNSNIRDDNSLLC